MAERALLWISGVGPTTGSDSRTSSMAMCTSCSRPIRTAARCPIYDSWRYATPSRSSSRAHRPPARSRTSLVASHPTAWALPSTRNSCAAIGRSSLKRPWKPRSSTAMRRTAGAGRSSARPMTEPCDVSSCTCRKWTWLRPRERMRLRPRERMRLRQRERMRLRQRERMRLRQRERMRLRQRERMRLRQRESRVEREGANSVHTLQKSIRSAPPPPRREDQPFLPYRAAAGLLGGIMRPNPPGLASM
ncbi:hypothetical protein B0T24DRAFT_228519 [Lasiosphaeria ovina]|uniref:Uncharacterized protein n=1 Tax=Lasiosphaeria ovina TaxID=92902 RepID=A0AAE0KJ12_9PEZI|nr:hypothetical protein B0T24DRAFT_228519 [Lasiosphaeria ovina]